MLRITQESGIDGIFKKALSGSELDEKESLKFKSHMLYMFGVMDAEKIECNNIIMGHLEITLIGYFKN